jgi:hypothetical protein
MKLSHVLLLLMLILFMSCNSNPVKNGGTAETKSIKDLCPSFPGITKIDLR